MLSLLAGRVKGGQAAVESLTASSSKAWTTPATITSAIVRTLDASGTSTSSPAKSSPATGTITKEKGNIRLEQITGVLFVPMTGRALGGSDQ